MGEYPPSRVERKLGDLARQARENELSRELGQQAEKFDELRHYPEVEFYEQMGAKSKWLNC